MYKTWEELSELEQLQQIYSDAYKDAYGIRPRTPVSWLVEDYRKELDYLQKVIEQSIEEEKEAMSRACVEFEERVAGVIAAGAHDRETALRWIMDADDANGDWEHLAYLNELPFSYFKTEPSHA